MDTTMVILKQKTNEFINNCLDDNKDLSFYKGGIEEITKIEKELLDHLNHEADISKKEEIKKDLLSWQKEYKDYQAECTKIKDQIKDDMDKKIKSLVKNITYFTKTKNELLNGEFKADSYMKIKQMHVIVNLINQQYQMVFLTKEKLMEDKLPRNINQGENIKNYNDYLNSYFMNEDEKLEKEFNEIFTPVDLDQYMILFKPVESKDTLEKAKETYENTLKNAPIKQDNSFKMPDFLMHTTNRGIDIKKEKEDAHKNETVKVRLANVNSYKEKLTKVAQDYLDYKKYFIEYTSNASIIPESVVNTYNDKVKEYQLVKKELDRLAIIKDEDIHDLDYDLNIPDKDMNTETIKEHLENHIPYDFQEYKPLKEEEIFPVLHPEEEIDKNREKDIESLKKELAHLNEEKEDKDKVISMSREDMTFEPTKITKKERFYHWVKKTSKPLTDAINHKRKAILKTALISMVGLPLFMGGKAKENIKETNVSNVMETSPIYHSSISTHDEAVVVGPLSQDTPVIVKVNSVTQPNIPTNDALNLGFKCKPSSLIYKSEYCDKDLDTQNAYGRTPLFGTDMDRNASRVYAILNGKLVKASTNAEYQSLIDQGATLYSVESDYGDEGFFKASDINLEKGLQR